jgi:hypothetical protein
MENLTIEADLRNTVDAIFDEIKEGNGIEAIDDMFIYLYVESCLFYKQHGLESMLSALKTLNVPDIWTDAIRISLASSK